MVSPPRTLGLVVALTLLVSGGVLAVDQYRQVSAYESTTATVERARIDTVSDVGEGERAPSGSLLGEQNQLDNNRLDDAAYAPNVTYTYTVDGRTYTGENVAIGTDMVTGNREKLEAILSMRQSGATTTVYYQPTEPGDAHLLQRYRFFPAGLLLVFGLLVLTDTLTPNLRFVRFLTSWLPISTLERIPGVETTAARDAPDDPEAILESQRTWAGEDPAPVRGGATLPAWILCYLFIADIAIVYFALSSRPYDLWVVVALFAVFTGLMRIGFRRLLN
jgi:hypothetical protein